MLVSDAKEYQGDLNTIGNFIIVAMGAMFLAFVFLAMLFAMVSTNTDGIGESGKVMEIAVAAAIGFGVVAILLFYQGFLFRIPMKVYEDRLEIQPRYGMKTKQIQMDKIKTVTMALDCSEWWPRGACVILSSEGYEYSHEHFRSKESLHEFISAIRQTMEQNGLKNIQEENDRKKLIITIRR